MWERKGSATPNLPNLRAVIKVCRESPAKLSQGTRLRGGTVGCGQFGVRGGKGSFPNSTTCQTGRQGRGGFFKKLEDGKEKMKEKKLSFIVISGKFLREQCTNFPSYVLEKIKKKEL